MQIRVYLLDDDPTIHSILGRAVEAAGFGVHSSALWSEHSRELSRPNAADDSILVCDLHLPGIRGEDFCRSVLKHNPRLQVVLYTGADEAEASAAAERLGGVPYVTKREGPQVLIEALHNCADKISRGAPSPYGALASSPPAQWSAAPPAPAGASFLLGASLDAPIKIGTEPLLIGRALSADVRVNCGSVSRRHASLQLRDGQVLIQDLRSRNGVVVNGERLQGETQLEDRATIRVGSVEFRLRIGLTDSEAGLLNGSLDPEETSAFMVDPARPTWRSNQSPR